MLDQRLGRLTATQFLLQQAGLQLQLAVHVIHFTSWQCWGRLLEMGKARLLVTAVTQLPNAMD